MEVNIKKLSEIINFVLVELSAEEAELNTPGQIFGISKERDSEILEYTMKALKRLADIDGFEDGKNILLVFKCFEEVGFVPQSQEELLYIGFRAYQSASHLRDNPHAIFLMRLASKSQVNKAVSEVISNRNEETNERDQQPKTDYR